MLAGRAGGASATLTVLAVVPSDTRTATAPPVTSGAAAHSASLTALRSGATARLACSVCCLASKNILPSRSISAVGGTGGTEAEPRDGARTTRIRGGAGAPGRRADSVKTRTASSTACCGAQDCAALSTGSSAKRMTSSVVQSFWYLTGAAVTRSTCRVPSALGGASTTSHLASVRRSTSSSSAARCAWRASVRAARPSRSCCWSLSVALTSASTPGVDIIFFVPLLRKKNVFAQQAHLRTDFGVLGDDPDLRVDLLFTGRMYTPFTL